MHHCKIPVGWIASIVDGFCFGTTEEAGSQEDSPHEQWPTEPGGLAARAMANGTWNEPEAMCTRQRDHTQLNGGEQEPKCSYTDFFQGIKVDSMQKKISINVSAQDAIG